jgi:hypothetical protein
MAMPIWKMEKTLLGWAISFRPNKIIASGETHEGLMFRVLLRTQQFSIEKLSFGVGCYTFHHGTSAWVLVHPRP